MNDNADDGRKDKKKEENVGTEGTADFIALGTTAGTVLMYR